MRKPYLFIPLYMNPRAIIEFAVEVITQGADIVAFGNGRFRSMGIKIAIGAFFNAPGDMNVQA